MNKKTNIQREIIGILIALFLVLPVVGSIAMALGIQGIIPAIVLTVLSGYLSTFIYK